VNATSKHNSERIKEMKATQLLHNLGQSIWLDNITRDLLNSGTLKRYITELSVTGLTSNPRSSITPSRTVQPTIPPSAMGSSAVDRVRHCSSTSHWKTSPVPPISFDRSTDKTNTVDGWTSLEVSPLLAYDTKSTLAAAKELHTLASRPNLFIKIPGTKEGLPAIEERSLPVCRST
jgi:transaldolase